MVSRVLPLRCCWVPPPAAGSGSGAPDAPPQLPLLPRRCWQRRGVPIHQLVERQIEQALPLTLVNQHLLVLLSTGLHHVDVEALRE